MRAARAGVGEEKLVGRRSGEGRAGGLLYVLYVHLVNNVPNAALGLTPGKSPDKVVANNLAKLATSPSRYYFSILTWTSCSKTDPKPI